MSAATATLRITITDLNNTKTRTVNVSPDALLLGVVLQACCGTIGITHRTTLQDIMTDKIVITAGTKTFNARSVEDIRHTVKEYGYSDASSVCLLVAVKTFRQHMQDQNEFFRKPAINPRACIS